MPLSGLLFDKDGTFVDFHRTWSPAAHRVMRDLSGGDADLLEQLAAAMHFDLETASFRQTSPFIAATNYEIAAIWAPILDEPNPAVFATALNRRLSEASASLIAPIGSPAIVFAALAQRGLALGIATNDAEATAHAQVAALRLQAHVSFVAGYDSGHGGKPGSGMIHAFARQLNVEACEIALVGDSLHDLEAAHAAGAIAIAVLSGPAERSILEPHADHIVETIDDLPVLIDRLSRIEAA